MMNIKIRDGVYQVGLKPNGMPLLWQGEMAYNDNGIATGRTDNPRLCQQPECYKDISVEPLCRLFCQKCSIERRKYYNNKQLACSKIVALAVNSGILPKLDGSINCVDCGKIATDYEHRDYMKPLEVDPVCRKCNIRRGRALNHDLPLPETKQCE